MHEFSVSLDVEGVEAVESVVFLLHEFSVSYVEGVGLVWLVYIFSVSLDAGDVGGVIRGVVFPLHKFPL